MNPDFFQQAFVGRSKKYLYLIGVVVLTMPFWINLYAFFTGSANVAEARAQLDAFSTDKNVQLILQLLPFLLLLIFLLLVVFLVHQRSPLTLVSTSKSMDFKRILVGFVSVFLPMLVLVLIQYFTSDDLLWNFKATSWFPLLLISLLLFPIQVAFEELLFRGYLLQAFGRLLGNKFPAIVLASVLFGVFHAANPEVEGLGWKTMIFYIGTGLFLSFITAVDQRLELAFGFHLGNNLLAALIVTSPESALLTDALFINTSAATTNIGEFLIAVLVFYPILFLFFAKIFQWKQLKSAIFGKIILPLGHTLKTP
ncbi:MAG: CPBP family intramembrane glutamic endopeptidase [Flavobacteriaceae bacterium]|nr:CPBP family intramembrane glutamic endopeptidase [Flavobacteriaceae bacterium]